MTKIEQGYEAQGYELPAGWTWDEVHEHRARYEITDYLVPLPLAGGRRPPCTCWGVPTINNKFLKH